MDWPKLISRKIWMTEKSWNFHTVFNQSLITRNPWSRSDCPLTSRTLSSRFKNHVQVLVTSIKGSRRKYWRKVMRKMTYLSIFISGWQWIYIGCQGPLLHLKTFRRRVISATTSETCAWSSTITIGQCLINWWETGWSYQQSTIWRKRKWK